MLRVRRRQFKILNGMDSCICDYRCVEINTSIPRLVCGAQDLLVWMNGKPKMITTTSSPGNGGNSTRRSGRTADQAA